jgi:hypothetical protein
MEFLCAIICVFLLFSINGKANRILDKVAKLSIVFAMCLCGSSYANEPVNMMDLSPPTRSWFRNPDGSCVQCSIGMAGVWCNDLNAASLLWDTRFGHAERGGSWPSRTEKYFDVRGIKAWSISGDSVNDTIPWMEWACKTGRFAAIGAGTAHFQTLYGRDINRKRWYVCNNNSTNRVDEYDDDSFRSLHGQSAIWVVILEKPSSPTPQFIQWAE